MLVPINGNTSRLQVSQHVAYASSRSTRGHSKENISPQNVSPADSANLSNRTTQANVSSSHLAKPQPPIRSHLASNPKVSNSVSVDYAYISRRPIDLPSTLEVPAIMKKLEKRVAKLAPKLEGILEEVADVETTAKAIAINSERKLEELLAEKQRAALFDENFENLLHQQLTKVAAAREKLRRVADPMQLARFEKVFNIALEKAKPTLPTSLKDVTGPTLIECIRHTTYEDARQGTVKAKAHLKSKGADDEVPDVASVMGNGGL